MSNTSLKMTYCVLVFVFFCGYFAYKFHLLEGWGPACVFFAAAIAALVVEFWSHKQFREYEITPIKASQYSWEFARYVKEKSPQFENLGFQLIGDFALLPEPYPLRARAFINGGGSCFGEIADLDGTHIFTFISVFADGTLLESGPLKPLKRPPEQSIPLRFSYLPGATVAKLFEHHQRVVKRLEKNNKTTVLQFEANQWPEIAHYGHRLGGWNLRKQGFIWTAPKPTTTSGAVTTSQDSDPRTAS